MTHSKRLQAYVTTALWSSTDDNDQPLDKDYDINDLSPNTLITMQADLDQFFKILEVSEALQNIDKDELIDGLVNGYTITQSLLEIALEYQDETRLAHDLWLTRNGHGAGFWDGDYGDDVGNKLTAIAKTFPEVSLYIGDDGMIYQA